MSLRWTDVPRIDWRGLCAAPGDPGDFTNLPRQKVRCRYCHYALSGLHPTGDGLFACDDCDRRER